ncbi:hypothetical protein ACQKE4_07980 [Halomonas sp. NPDC076908]|uniref:hypothetical protein n=1 Tax=Halomonas sp. NPDC076908 TaxID=3390567 RepID=UPI003D08969D
MSQNVDLLVHIGPLREESETLLKHVNLVTLLAPLSPMPERQQALAQTLSTLHVAEQPVTPPGGEAVCYVYTLKDFNSLAPVSELTSLYPGLGKARHQSVDTQTLPQALKQAGLSQATLTHLIIEQPEIALSLLQAFEHSGLLGQLTQLWVRTSPLRLYEGMATSVELTQWCEQQGFEVVAQDAEEDPDFFLLGFARNPLHHKLKDTLVRLAEREAQLSQLSAERDTLQNVLDETEQNSKQNAQQTQQQLEEKAAQLKEKDTQLLERASQLEQLTQECDTLKETLEETEQHSKQRDQQAQQQLEEKDAQLAERDIQLSQLTEERDALKKQLSQAAKASQQHQKEHQESEQRLKDVTQSYEDVEQQLQSAEQAGQQAQKKLEETHAWFMARKQQAEEGAEQIKTLQAQLTTQQAQMESLQEKLTLSEEESENYQRYFANRKKQHEEAEDKLADTQQQLAEKDTIISQLNEQLATLKQSNERFGQLESKLESLFGEQRSYIQQTTSALGQHVTRSARQQRDEQALTHYLQYGQRPVSTPLAPGYAMALLEYYDTQHHDVVVIFGGTHTTELLAQSIINARAEQPRLMGQNGQPQEAHNEVTLSHDDLPQTIVSIHHQKTVSNELKASLNNKRLSHAVNVVYAPWGECQANDQTALFYAADSTLQRLNQWLPEDARVLVIVGETLPEAGHSREVALPLLLKQLPTQRLDVVLEGSDYPQESELTTRWGALLETRQRPAQWLTLPDTHSLRVEG